MEEYYNRKVTKYGISDDRLRHIRELMPKESLRVLDVGCGNGSLAKVLQNDGHQIYGTDVSPEALKDAKGYLEQSYCFNVEDESWPEDLMKKKFDVIIATEIIEHIFMPEPFMRNLKSLVEPHGVIIVTTPNVVFWKNRLKILFGKFRYETSRIMDFGHIRLFTRATAKELFNKVDLKVDREHHFYTNLHHRGLDFLGKFLPGLLAFQLIFRLKK